MVIRLLSPTLLLLSGILLSGRALAFEFPIEITEYVDEVRIAAYINKEDIDNNVKWTPFEGPPPLSIHEALKAVQEFMMSDSNLTKSTLVEIELRQIPHHEKSWHYLVRVRYQTEDKIRSHFFLVLMDGKVISAIREPESIK